MNYQRTINSKITYENGEMKKHKMMIHQTNIKYLYNCHTNFKKILFLNKFLIFLGAYILNIASSISVHPSIWNLSFKIIKWNQNTQYQNLMIVNCLLVVNACIVT